MPRQAKGAKKPKQRAPTEENAPQPSLTEESVNPEPRAPKDRDDGGKFTKGNAGGPGNPHARSCARMLEMFRNAISEEEMFRLVRKLFEKAEAGDMSAAKMIFSYKIGKPLPAPHPDSIDRDEWDHYQKDAMNDKEMALVMNGLPTAVGNDIARVSLPIMTAARKNDLGRELLKGCPAPEEWAASEGEPSDVDADSPQVQEQAETGKQVELREVQQKENASPIPNGEFHKNTNGRGATKTKRSAAKMNRSRTPDSRSAKDAPIPNGKKTTGKKRTSKRKSAWIQEVAEKVMCK